MARYVIDEAALTPERARLIEQSLRERMPYLRSFACRFTPPGTRVVRSVFVPVDRRAEFEREVERGHVHVVRDAPVRGANDPDDPKFPGQWALHNPGGFDVGSVTAVAGMDIGAPCGWQFLADHPSAATLPRYALVVDTGVAQVPDLDGVFGPITGLPGSGPHGVDLIDDDLEPLLAADAPDAGTAGNFLARSHGTMTAGIIAARTNNAAGIAGAVGPDGATPLRLVSARALAATSTGQVTGSTADVLCALHYGAVLAASLRQQGLGRLVAVNLSLTSVEAGANPATRARFEEAFAALAAEEVLVLAATGNADNTVTGECDHGPQYPSTSHAPNVLAVGGANADGHPLYCRDVAVAPLAAPATLVDAPTVIPSGDPGTYRCQGTSCAAPLATAAALMVAAARPAIGAADLKHLLVSTALPVPAFSGVPSASLVNVCRALNAPEAAALRPPHLVWEGPTRPLPDPPGAHTGAGGLVPPRNPEPPPEVR